jgi:PRC-barrel domain
MVGEERETGNLIGSDMVEGAAVYGSDRQKIGNIERVMIDKISGRVSYAVLSFGGFLGVGDDHYPLPWQSLKYDTDLGGYVTGITEDRLRGAPKYSEESAWNWTDPAASRSVDIYYGVPT